MKKRNVPKEKMIDTAGEELFSIDAYGMTIEKVAMYFAETYFDKPRKVDVLTQDCKFTLVDGLRVYQIKFVKGDYRKTTHTFKVYA